MDPVVGAFAQFLSLNEHLLVKAIDGLSDEELRHHPGSESNPMLWLAGHLAGARSMLARALGTGVDVPWAHKFAQKSQPDENGDYPSGAEILATIKTLGNQLRERFAQMSDADLSGPSPRDFPIPDKTLRGMIAFVIYHESYHVGQIAYVKKWLGYPGVVDGQ